MRGMPTCEKEPREIEDEERWRRDVALSGGMGAVLLEVVDVVDATEAECARRAVSSRVRRLTFVRISFWV